MRPLSPRAAATAGVTLIRREPWAFVAWTVLWLAAFTLAAFVVAASKPNLAASDVSTVGRSDAVAAFGPFGAPLAAMFLLVWLVTVVAAFRAMLRPDDRRFFYLRLGTDELRLGLLTGAAFFGAIGAGGAPAYMVFVLMSPILGAAPGAERLIVEAGVVVTVAIELWLSVRLSLIAVETVAERRIHLTAYWPMTRGRFWYLAGVYALFFVMLLGLSLVFFAVALVLTPGSLAPPVAGDWLRRGTLLLQAGLLAGLVSLFFTLSLTLFCACQAHAFGAISGADQSPK